MSYGLYTTEAEDHLIISLAESYQGNEDDIHNLLDVLVERAYNRGKNAGFDQAFDEGLTEGRREEYEYRNRARF